MLFGTAPTPLCFPPRPPPANTRTNPPPGRTSQALCVAAAYAAKEKGTEKVAVFTESGLMARRLSSFRSGLNPFAITTSEDACHQLALIWGVRPLFHKP